MPVNTLNKIDNFPKLSAYLLDELGWPFDENASLDDHTFDYTPTELGLPGGEAFAGIEIRTLRPLAPQQPWGIVWLQFHKRAMSIGALRKVLRAFVRRKRESANATDRPTWELPNLLFVCSHDRGGEKGITFVHFDQTASSTPKLSAFEWTQSSYNRTVVTENLARLKWPDDPSNSAARLSEWKKAFDVEAVTQKFYTQYKDLFTSVEAQVQGIGDQDHLRLYTQRLFNRLLFLYFIQKKGWLEFAGSKNYLRAMWQTAEDAKENYLHHRLDWVFFLCLNTPPDERDAATNAKCDRAPFLNGGLFEREEPYDVRGAVQIPNAAFDSILKLFEKYNFTVAESTPLDVEVAVDPEMLGKVFEELVTGRHESGSYYTPRAIVSFMCREALKHYLAGSGEPAPSGVGVSQVQLRPLTGPARRASVVSPESIARFVDDGDPSGLTNAEAILDALRNVTVCDPACGSGAYLLGMMQELLRLRDILFAAHAKDHESTYARKLEIIQKNLHGVDLDPFAVNIAKLRLWLSLAVDYTGTKPKPLPNLDYKIEWGDSLLGPEPLDERSLMGEVIARFGNEIAALKAEYVCSSEKRKVDLKKAIRNIKAEYASYRNVDCRDGIIEWRVDFAEVFKDGGFDIVVGNPPYVRQESIKHLKPKLKDNNYLCYTGTADLFVYFYERGIQLLKPGGQFAFITSNKWFRSGYGGKLRDYLAAKTRLHRLIDFGDAPVFEAIAYPTIVLLERTDITRLVTEFGTPSAFLALTWPPAAKLDDFLDVVREQSFAIPQASLDKTGWRLEGDAKRNLLAKLRAGGTPLGEYCGGRFYRGVLTGLNEAFVVDRATRDRLIAEHPSSAAVLKPFLRGRDVKRWRVESQDKWLIFTRRGIEINKFPAIKKYLTQFKAQLKPGIEGGRKAGSYEWYEIQDNIAYWQEFEKPKIIVPAITDSVNYAADAEGFFSNDKTNIFIPPSIGFTLAVLNSTISMWITLQEFATKQGGFFEFKPMYVSKLPIPSATPQQQSELERLTYRLTQLKVEGTAPEKLAVLEEQVNDRVADLFHLTPEERRLIAAG